MTSWITALSKASSADILQFLGISGSLDQYKIVILIFIYMGAFFSFTQSMRYLSELPLFNPAIGIRDSTDVGFAQITLSSWLPRR
jgi:hypothetical protein